MSNDLFYRDCEIYNPRGNPKLFVPWKLIRGLSGDSNYLTVDDLFELAFGESCKGIQAEYRDGGNWKLSLPQDGTRKQLEDFVDSLYKYQK